jgi:large-conductance mechanosensitive channel
VTVTAAAAQTDYGPGLVGFLVVAARGFALFFLIKSMNRQISKIEVPSEDEQRRAESQEQAQ